MFPGMSDKTFKDRVTDQQSKDKQDIDDWMQGSGVKVLGAILILLALWGIVRMVWSF